MKVRGVGSAIFAATLLLIAGTLNVIYGVANIADSAFYVNGSKYIFSEAHTWGWIGLFVGIIQMLAGFSLFGGGAFGRVIGIFAASIGAIASLLAIGGQHPFWALGVFAICIIVLHGLIVLGEVEERRPPAV